MSSQQEKLLFSERLKEALTQANHPISPTFISKQFNARYSGEPISVQSANNWLLAKAIPNQDKLAILSLWLNVSNQWLRFGDEDTQTGTNTFNTDVFSAKDYDLLLKFNKLSETQKMLILNLMDEFQIN